MHSIGSAAFYLGILLPVTPLLIAMMLTKARGLSSPLFLITALYIFGTFMKMGYFIRYPELVANLPAAPIDWFELGSFALFLGSLSFVFGYLTPKNKALKVNFLNLTSPPTVVIKGAYFSFVALSVMLLFLYLQKLNFVGNIMSGRLIGQKFFYDENSVKSSYGFLSMGAEFCVIIAAFAFGRPENTKLQKYGYSLILFLALIAFLISTQRLSMIYTLIILGLAMSSGKKLGNTFRNIQLGAVFVFLIAIATTLRSQGRRGTEINSTFENLGQSFDTILLQLFSRPYFLTLDKTGLIIDWVQTNSAYLMGQSYFALLSTPIPRIWWPEKPNIRIGPHIAQNVYGNFTSGIPPGMVAELFLNFSWLGIIFGMYGLGLASRFSYNNFIVNRENSIDHRIFYSIFLISFVFIAVVADFNGGMLRFIKLSIAFIICKAFWGRKISR